MENQHTDPHAHVDALMDRAYSLLGFLTPEAAAEVMSSNVAAGEAFLAVTDIQTISDTDTLCAIVNALPRMHQRLVEDSRVSPEDIMEAVAAARSFLDIRS